MTYYLLHRLLERRGEKGDGRDRPPLSQIPGSAPVIALHIFSLFLRILKFVSVSVDVRFDAERLKI